MNDYLRRCDAYGLALITAPTEEPITTDEAKLQMRVDDDEDDEYIEAIIEAARDYVEAYVGRRLVTQTWDIVRNEFPVGDREIVLPFGPIQSITHIKYTDTGGTLQTLSSALYTLDTYSTIPRAYPVYGSIWPATRDQRNAVQIRVIAGYGLPSSGLQNDNVTPGIIPPKLLHALKLLVAHMYENREPVVVGTITAELPMSIKQLLDAERVNWL